jgi:hypothetical protein
VLAEIENQSVMSMVAVTAGCCDRPCSLGTCNRPFIRPTSRKNAEEELAVKETKDYVCKDAGVVFTNLYSRSQDRVDCDTGDRICPKRLCQWQVIFPFFLSVGGKYGATSEASSGVSWNWE